MEPIRFAASPPCGRGYYRVDFAVMILKLIFSSSVIFGTIYPLMCWTHAGVPVMKSFHRFNAGLALFAASIALPCALVMGGAALMSGLAALWLVCTLVIACAYWNRDAIHEWVVSLPSILGATLFAVAAPAVFGDITPSMLVISVIAGIVVAAAVYSTTFGHWFLETKGRVPIQYLTSGVIVLWAALAARAAWDLTAMVVAQARLYGEPVPLWSFMLHLDGVLLGAAVLAGTLIPLVLVVFVHKTLRIRSTISATGLLYAMLIAILLGDLMYRHYLISHGLAL